LDLTGIRLDLLATFQMAVTSSQHVHRVRVEATEVIGFSLP
jgi:hypothetical protein